MKIFLCFLIGVMLIAPLASYSQIDYTIKGKIVISNGDFSTGNVLVLQTSDSTLITGASFYEENFIIENIDQPEVLLKFTSLQFSDTYVPVKNNGEAEIDLGEVLVEASSISLDAVEVRARRPVFTQRADGTVEVLVANTTLSSSNSVSEMLSRTPEVGVSPDGGISVFGKGAAIMFLNGVRIADEQLSMIPPANIKKIEIIRNPSARYDSAGGAVINITTIRNTANGYNGSLRHNFSYSDFASTLAYSNLSLNYKNGRFSTNANYSLKTGTERELLFTTRNRKPEDEFLTTDLTTDWDRDIENYSNYGLGVQYDIDKTSYISAKYTGFHEFLGGNTVSDNRIADDTGVTFYNSDIAVDEKGVNNSVSLNFNKTLDTLGSSIFIGGQYSRFDIGGDNSITELSTVQSVTTSRLLENLLNLDIDIYSGQFDYTKVFKNKGKLEFGGKYSFVENDFNFEFLVSNDNGGNFFLDPERSNDFNYQEAITAGYVSYRNSWNKLNYSIGLRTEHTNYDLKLSTSDDLADSYTNFFPNLSISRSFPNKNTLSFSYSARINRPAYQTLNPILIYSDPFTSVQGNPALTPEIVHGLEFVSKVKKLSLKWGYNYTDNAFVNGVVRGEEPNSYVLTMSNAKEKHSLYAIISRTLSNDWWTSTNTASFRYTKIVSGVFEFEQLGSNINPYFYTNNRFKIFDTFYAEALFWIRGRAKQGLYDRSSLYNLTCTLEKTFFEKSLKVRFIANDIFHSMISEGRYSVGQTDIFFNRRWTTDYYRLALVYNFGKLKKFNYKNRSSGASENRRVQ